MGAQRIGALLRRHLTAEDVEFLRERLRSGGKLPELLIGAVNVKRMTPCGQSKADELPNKTNFKVFRASREDPEDLVNAALASAAMPTLMRAVRQDGADYWDGLFSQNPPVYDLPDVCGGKAAPGDDEGIQEIWVVLINPLERDTLPERMEDILDRRNELAGNNSLLQEARAIHRMGGNTISGRYYRDVRVRFLGMEAGFAKNLKAWSKLDRRQESIARLVEHGAERARRFLEGWRKETRDSAGALVP